MGRRCGDVALKTGIAVGATAILVPEVPFNFERDVIAKMLKTQKTGKKHFIIIVAEGVGGIDYFTRRIQEATGIEARGTVLGHVQRGGSPTLRDRVMASNMGHRAVECLKDGIGNRIIAVQNGKVVDLDINEALNMKKTIDRDLYNVALEISI